MIPNRSELVGNRKERKRWIPLEVQGMQEILEGRILWANRGSFVPLNGDVDKE